MLLRNWYSKLQSDVRWNNFVGVWFPILCGVPQGGVLSPYLFAFYVKQSGYGIYTVRHKKLHHFVFAITLSYLSLFEYLLVHTYRDKFGTN